MLNQPQINFMTRALENDIRAATVADGEHLAVGDLLFRGLVVPVHEWDASRYRLTTSGLATILKAKPGART